MVIPFLNRTDLLRRCLLSIDYPVANVVVIDNSDGSVNTGFNRVFEGAQNIALISVIEHDNAGVAQSWNEAIKLFPAPYWMLVNNDIAFARGDLENMALSAAQHPDVGAIYGNHGASFWIVTELGIEKVGLFDENIYPAYTEDCDWSTRADRLDVKRMNSSYPIKSVHGDHIMPGSCTIHSDALMRAENGRTHQANMDYYVAKWGGRPGEEKFKTPFDDPHWPIDFWRYDPKRRKDLQWKI